MRVQQENNNLNLSMDMTQKPLIWFNWEPGYFPVFAQIICFCIHLKDT